MGGPVLARGYVNPELNESRFIKKPSGLSKKIPERLYRTGDLGRLLSNGTLEICGRSDSMVKIRGYSVEKQVGCN